MTTKEQLESLISLYNNLAHGYFPVAENELVMVEKVELIKLTISKLTKLVNTI